MALKACRGWDVLPAAVFGLSEPQLSAALSVQRPLRGSFTAALGGTVYGNFGPPTRFCKGRCLRIVAVGVFCSMRNSGSNLIFASRRSI